MVTQKQGRKRMTPLYLNEIFSNSWWMYLLIGFGFGFILEKAGFGDSRKLAAQFYFTDMRVLKVMMSAIIVTMVLVFFFSSIGLLDFSKVYMNPTFLWPQAVGGFVMGIGFIMGGFCPGTSLVGAATLKIDALVFVLGVLFGVFIFGETVPAFNDFFNSGSYGKYSLFDLFQIDAGIIVLVVFLIGLIAFERAEWGEKKMGYVKSLESKGTTRLVFGLTGFLALLVAVTLFKGQPKPDDRWAWVEPKFGAVEKTRDFHVHPKEVRDLMIDPSVSLRMLDLRKEKDFNLFHIENSQNVSLSDFQSAKSKLIKKMQSAPANRVFILISASDKDATEAWKLLKGIDVLNAYVLDGGINHWLDVFALDKNFASLNSLADLSEDKMKYTFYKTVGSSQFSSYPIDPLHGEHKQEHADYVKKVKLQSKSVAKGGCG